MRVIVLGAIFPVLASLDVHLFKCNYTTEGANKDLRYSVGHFKLAIILFNLGVDVGYDRTLVGSRKVLGVVVRAKFLVSVYTDQLHTCDYHSNQSKQR